MDFYQIDVFADSAFTGNPLAVYPDAAELTGNQMQRIATEMNLSETTFVTSAGQDSYDVRIFTPNNELPFAGHPTVGTAWLLRQIDVLPGDEVVQNSAAGATKIEISSEGAALHRTGTADKDLALTKPDDVAAIAAQLGLSERDLGMEARELGRSGFLSPAFSDAGLKMLIVPVKDLTALGKCESPRDVRSFGDFGAYCFTAVGAGRIRARGLWPGAGIPEDPATGAGAAALGIYLADRIGPIEAEVVQGVEINRPSRIALKADDGRVRIAGTCHFVFKGQLQTLPG